MPRTIQELQKRVLDLEKLNRCQAVKIWQLEEEKMDLVEKVERLVRKEDGLREREGEAESNQGRTVHFGGVHFSDDSVGRKKIGCSNAVEEIETVLVDGTPLQELENTGGCHNSEQQRTDIDCNGQMNDSMYVDEGSPPRSPVRDVEVLPSRQEQRNFLVEEREVEENEPLGRGHMSEDSASNILEGEKDEASNLEVEEGGDVMDTSEKEENQLLVEDLSTTSAAGQDLVTKEKQTEGNLGLVENPLTSKCVGKVAVVDGENDLENSNKLRRVLRGEPKTLGKRLAGKALKKELQAEETSAPRKRRLASQGKLKVGDRLKVAWGGKFYSCKVVVVRQSALKVHYMGWGAEFEEWVPFPSNKVKLDK